LRIGARPSSPNSEKSWSYTCQLQAGAVQEPFSGALRRSAEEKHDADPRTSFRLHGPHIGFGLYKSLTSIAIENDTFARVSRWMTSVVVALCVVALNLGTSFLALVWARRHSSWEFYLDNHLLCVQWGRDTDRAFASQLFTALVNQRLESAQAVMQSRAHITLWNALSGSDLGNRLTPEVGPM
jgi:hypothetical protein